VTLEVRDLRVRVGDRLLVDVVALTVPTGGATAILGPNGAGKSTLLRALGLLSRHRVTGQVLLDGAPMTPARSRASVAAVLQRPVLRRGTVVDNAADGLRFRGVDRRAARREVAPWLEALGIPHLSGRDVRSLSGGEAQRVCLVRALAVAPRVLLLDEPFTGLDNATRADLLADLRAALDQHPTATVLVTHDQGDARALADTTVLLVAGRVRSSGLTARVLDDPVDSDTARLLGFTNLISRAIGSQKLLLAARPRDCRVVDLDAGRPAVTHP
jgi:tungstate transport system ATP-binding protein